MKKIQKLVLNRETLRNLDPKNLAGRVVGGRPADSDPCGSYDACTWNCTGGIPSINPCSDYTENC